MFAGMWKFVPTRPDEKLTDEQKKHRFGQIIRGETMCQKDEAPADDGKK